MKYLQIISDSSQIDKSLEYDVLYYNSTSTKAVVKETNPITSTTYSVNNISNPTSLPYDATSMVVSFTGVKTETYKKGQVEVTESSETQTVSFAANTSSAETATRSGSFEWNEQSVAWSTTLGIVPSINITMNDNYTDTDIIALSAEKSASVEGTIAWSCNLASSVAEINGSTLTFKQHYEGSVSLTATTSNASAEKTITVTCEEVATATTYSIKANSISIAETQPMDAESTSATVNFVGITTQHYKLKDGISVESNETQTVSFAANTSSAETATRNGSFEWNEQSVEWEVTLDVLKQWELDPTKYIEEDGKYYEYLYDPTQRTIEDVPAIIDLNGNEWTKFDEDDNYDYYKSMNKGIDNSYYQFCVTWSGVENIKFLYRSYAESSYDYLVVGNLDGDKFTSSPSTSSGQAHTSGKQTETYNTLNITCSTDEHHIWFCYSKDSSDASNDDTAYVGVPKLQTITDGKTKKGEELPFDWVNDGYIQEDNVWYFKEVKEYSLGNGSKVKSSVYRKGGEVVLEMVDLGLPSGLKWVNMNVGASLPWEYGKYFQWGDTVGYEGDEAKAHSTWSTAPFNNGSRDYDSAYFGSVSGTVCPNGVLATQYDAATAAYGEGYRMPTLSDYEELYDNTTSVWVSNYEGTGVNGRLFTSKINGQMGYVI